MTLALFFVPVKIEVGGISLAPSDIASLLSLSLSALIILESKTHKLLHPYIGFVLLFIGYVFINGVLNDVPFLLLIAESIQWVAIVSLLGVLYAYGAFNNDRIMVYFTYVLFVVCALVVAWHLALAYQNGSKLLSGFKLLGVSKYAFGLLCSLLYLYREKIRLFPFLMIIACILLVLSMERKALLGFCLLVLMDQIYIKHQLKQTLSETYTWGLLLTFSMIMLAAISTTFYIGFDQLADQLEITNEDILFASQTDAIWVSNLHRKLLLANGLDILQQHLFFGVGAKMRPSFMVDYFNYEELAIYTHNFVLDTAIEYGLLGIALLFGGYFLFIKNCLKNLETNRISLLLAVYALTMLFFVAVNTTVILILLLPVMLSTRERYEPNEHHVR